jgi:hypothetical protein
LSEAGLSEVQLEHLIANDPSILGLGEVVLIERQRNQERAGRLDLLLEDRDGESRFEVELKIGSLDESHLVRAIEYWDIERLRYPAYAHVAVVIAEDLTSRFLNVIQLFSGSIPIVAIRVSCIKFEETFALSFIKLIDKRALRRDDRVDAKTKSTNRESWLSYVGPDILKIADDCLETINASAKRKRGPNYNQQYIGLTDGGKPDNFVYFHPLKSRMRVCVAVSPVEPWIKRLEDSPLDFKSESEALFIDVTTQTFAANRPLIDELLLEAVKQDEGN